MMQASFFSFWRKYNFTNKNKRKQIQYFTILVSWIWREMHAMNHIKSNRSKENFPRAIPLHFTP
jgi:hypothetical protein